MTATTAGWPAISVRQAVSGLKRLVSAPQKLARLEVLRRRYGHEFAERVAAKADFPREAQP